MATPLLPRSAPINPTAVGTGSLPASPFQSAPPTPIGGVGSGGGFAPNPSASGSQPLQSAQPSFPSSVPLPGKDSLPSSIDELEASFKEPEKPGILKSIGRGIADIALQPARALEQIGKFFGTLGLSEEQKKRVDEFMGPGIQERAFGETYATPTPKDARQTAGIALKAGANLATPFTTSIPGMALQGAAAAGGTALEEGRSNMSVAGEALFGAGASALLGKLINTGGAVVGRGFAGAKNEIAQSLRPIADKIGPTLTGTTRKEFDMAFKEAPHIFVDYLNTIKGAPTLADAEGLLQNRLLTNVREVVKSATKTEGDAFETAIKSFNEAHPDVRVDVHAVANRLKAEMPAFGRPRNADEKFALEEVQKIIQEPREYTVDGTRTLLQDLYSFADGLETGSPAERLAMKAWKDVRDELTKAASATGDNTLDDAMARYSEFKELQQQLRPVNAANEDTARSFVRNLAGTNKTASREALVRMGEIAENGEAIPAIDVYRLMSRLTATGKLTGSRVQDIMVGGGAVAGAQALGSMIAGPPGAALGTVLGTAAAGRALAPSTVTDIMLSNLRSAGIKPTSAVRQALEKIINDPTWRQGILNALQGQNEPQD
jgi:hypothetical protein